MTALSGYVFVAIIIILSILYLRFQLYRLVQQLIWCSSSVVNNSPVSPHRWLPRTSATSALSTTRRWVSGVWRRSAPWSRCCARCQWTAADWRSLSASTWCPASTGRSSGDCCSKSRSVYRLLLETAGDCCSKSRLAVHRPIQLTRSASAVWSGHRRATPSSSWTGAAYSYIHRPFLETDESKLSFMAFPINDRRRLFYSMREGFFRIPVSAPQAYRRLQSEDRRIMYVS